jgi:aconitase B
LKANKFYLFLLPTYTRKFATRILSYADRCRAAGKLFAVCAFEGLFPEMKSFVRRIHRGISERSDISYSAAFPKVHCLFHITSVTRGG